MYILIADDHRMLLDMLKDLIESKIANAQVHTVTNYSEFEKKLKSDIYFDLAIMDYHMPGVQGIKNRKIFDAKL